MGCNQERRTNRGERTMYDAALWAYEPMGDGGPNRIFFAKISHNFVGRAGNSRYLPEVSEFAKTF